MLRIKKKKYWINYVCSGIFFFFDSLTKFFIWFTSKSASCVILSVLEILSWNVIVRIIFANFLLTFWKETFA